MDTLPRNVIKYCSRCGSNAITHFENNAIVCSDCDFHSHINEVSAVACLIVNEKGEVLLSKRKHKPEAGKYDLPGGFVDIGESAEQAVLREMKEELSTEVSNMKYIASYPNKYLYSGIIIYTLDLCFLCEIKSSSTLKANDDVASFEFFKLEEIPEEIIAFESVKKILKDPIVHKYLKEYSQTS